MSVASKSGDAPIDAYIESRFERLKGLPGERALFDTVIEIVNAVFHKLRERVTAEEERIQEEIRQLADIIQKAKKEIEAARPEDIRTQHLPIANGELTAIINHLEEATGTILDSCEALENLGEELEPEQRDKLIEAVTRIYEACNFHDLTGQRITKVIHTLQKIEARIDALISTFGDRAARAGPARAETAPQREEERLLNGPALPGEGTTQAEIDALFDSTGRA